MNPLKSITTHWKWNCSTYNQTQQQQQQPQADTMPVDEPSSQTSGAPEETSSTSSSDNEASENSKSTSQVATSASKSQLIASTEVAASSVAPVTSPPDDASENSSSSGASPAPTSKSSPSASTTGSSSSEVAISSPSEGEVALQREKRKEPETDPGTPTSSTSEPNKRIKNTIIECDVALEVLSGLNPFDKGFLNSGRTLAWALQPDDPDFLRIHEYADNSQDPAMPFKIASILRIMSRTDELEDDAPLDFSDHPDAPEMLRMMLWYGTKRTNVVSILEDGLTLPNLAYGGISFADRVGLSSFHCDPAPSPSAGYIFLCEVLLSKRCSWNESSYMDSLSTVGAIRCRSRKMSGRIVPDKEADVDVDGCVWPLGASVVAKSLPPGEMLWGFRFYNEYVVFNSAQAQPKFLVKVKF